MPDNREEPAFPQSETLGRNSFNHEYGNGGLTKREWYAGMALQGLVSVPEMHPFNHADAARMAFWFADAMLATSKEKT